jgi:hypothetical protein
LLLKNHYQNAYVTRDIDQAIAFFRSEYAFDGFNQFEVASDITTPAGRGTCVLKMALGWIGAVQYELIQPVSGMVDIYRDDLPDQYPLRFHHSCARVDDWAVFRAEVERRQWPVVIEGSGRGGEMEYLYVDARKTLGHYLEYCWMTPARWAQLGGR